MRPHQTGLAARLGRQGFGRTALAFGLLALALVPLAGALAPPLYDQARVTTAYGVHDNRALIFGYWGLLAALALAPFGALLLPWHPRTRAMASEPDLPDLAGEPPASGATGRAVERPRSHGPRAWATAGVTLLLVGGLFIGPGVRYRALNGHEIPHLGYLAQLEKGKLLNLDTRTAYGPLLGYSIYGFMKATSFSLAGFRAYWNVVTALTLAGLILLSAPYWRSRGLFCVAIGYLVLHTSARFYLPDAQGIHGGFWGWGNVLRHGWVPLTVLALAGPLGRPGWAPALLLGVAVALGASYAPESAVGGVAAGAALLGVTRGGSVRALLTSLALCGAGAFFTSGLLLGEVIRRGGLDAFVAASTAIPALVARGVSNHAYFAPLAADRGGLPALLPYYLLPLAVLGVALVVWHATLAGRSPGPVLLPIVAGALLAWPSVLASCDLEHLLNSSLTPTLALFLCLDAFLQTWGPRLRPTRRLLTALLALPLLILKPGLPDLARGALGRLLHPSPRPPAGLTPLDLPRAGIWVPSDSCWFDGPAWGSDQDPAAIEMLEHLGAGRRVHVMGKRAGLIYFLARLEAASPYTDPGTQCLVVDEWHRLWATLRAAPPDFVFAEASEPGGAPGERDGFRRLGTRHGYIVCQRLDLEPVPLDP